MKSVNRRQFLKISGTTLIGMTLGGTALRANAQEVLSEDDPAAKALKYVAKSATDGQICKGCAYASGEGENLNCALFPGKLVSAEGWCAAFVAKPS